MVAPFYGVVAQFLGVVARLHRCGECQGDLFRDFAFNGTMATWRSSIRWKSTASSDDEVESDFDEDVLAVKGFVDGLFIILEPPCRHCLLHVARP